MPKSSNDYLLSNGMYRRNSLPVTKDGHYTKEENVPLLDGSGTATVVVIEEVTSDKRRSLDVAITFMILLFAESARGIVLPTLAPYVDKISKDDIFRLPPDGTCKLASLPVRNCDSMIGGDSVFLGYAVAAFSVGRFASTIGLGYLSTRYSYGKVLGWSVFFCIVGNIMYSFGTVAGKYVLLSSRFITGFGAGTLSVVRAYVAHVTTHDERTSYMSILGAVQFLGFAITPGLGSILSYLPTFSIAGLPFDQFTYPGWFLAVANFLILAVLVLEFKNPPSSEVVEVAISINSTDTAVQLKPEAPKRTTKMIKMFAVFLVLNLLVRLVLGIIETLGTPMYISMWGNATGKATQAGFVFAAMGLVGIFALFFISYISKIVSDFVVLVVGLVCLALGSGLLIGTQVDLTRFLLGAGLIWCIGFPLAQTIIVSMFSKSLGRAPQGTWMGWIGAMGSLGRILGPIGAGYLYEHSGQWSAMLFGTAMSILSLFVVLFIIPTKKPYQLL